MKRLAAEGFGTFFLVFAGTGAVVVNSTHPGAVTPVGVAPKFGAGLNPARSRAPAVVSGRLDHLWVYLSAPVLGAGLTAGACVLIHAPRCWPAAADPSLPVRAASGAACDKEGRP